MDSLNEAIQIASFFHEGQLDKGGNPYILHPLRVMMKMNTKDERIVALLHDVIEDTECTIDELKQHFTSHVVEAIASLTRNEGESYIDFICRCKQNELARKVKIADIEDNMDLSRIEQPTKRDYDRVKKYKKALIELKENISIEI